MFLCALEPRKELLTDGRNKFKDGQDEKVQELCWFCSLRLSPHQSIVISQAFLRLVPDLTETEQLDRWNMYVTWSMR